MSRAHAWAAKAANRLAASSAASAQFFIIFMAFPNVFGGCLPSPLLVGASETRDAGRRLVVDMLPSKL